MIVMLYKIVDELEKNLLLQQISQSVGRYPPFEV